MRLPVIRRFLTDFKITPPGNEVTYTPHSAEVWMLSVTELADMLPVRGTVWGKFNLVCGA